MPDTGGGFTYFRSGAEREGDVEAEPQAEAAPDDDKGKDKPAKTGGGDADYPEDGTIPDVKDWIGDDLGRAQTAYGREQDRAGGPRVTLVDYLDDLLADDDDES